MKFSPQTIVIIVALGIGAPGCVHRNTDQPTNAYGTDDERYVTGSYLPQDVQNKGPVTTGKDDVRVVDRPEIDRSGGATVEEVLRRTGATH
jgi:hypothetical protein